VNKVFDFWRRRGQVSLEYVVMVGFVILVIAGVMTLAMVYIGTIRDNTRMNQIVSYSNKIISAAESVFYAGQPSKTTITTYLPDGVSSIEITEDNLVFTVSTSSGPSKVAFQSNVPISGSLESSRGLRRVQVEAQSDTVVISHL